MFLKMFTKVLISACLALSTMTVAVPINILEWGDGSRHASGTADVLFKINYAKGLPHDVHTINSITFDLRTPGYDSNASFANNARVVYSPSRIHVTSFDNDVDNGRLTVNFKPYYFDSGETL